MNMTEELAVTPELTELDAEVSTYELKAQSIVVESDNDFAAAGELTKQIKLLQKKVEDYWEPMRATAYDAYQTVLGKKKEMIDPMKKAEKILKDKMAAFTIIQERERRKQEAELRRQAQEEAEKKLKEAVEAETSGDAVMAEYAMAEAEVMAEAALSISIERQPAKTDGVSRTKSWEITGIDESKVPISVGGAVIRPVDEKAILRLIKASKGQIAIPGVEYKETYNISVRA